MVLHWLASKKHAIYFGYDWSIKKKKSAGLLQHSFAVMKYRLVMLFLPSSNLLFSPLRKLFFLRW